MSLNDLIKFNLIGDDRGSLVSLERYQDIPFDVKRVYYIFDTQENVSRGFHAHKQLHQVAVCVKGSCEFVLDNGFTRESVILDRPDVGLLITNMTWREMHNFSNDCVLVVLASDVYDESDYIRNYSEYLDSVRGQNER
jgi:dTDP-4-dehydrorhamnose 3,5-epimerase-like enzyme